MVLLDSDHMSLLQRGGAEGHRIKQRLGDLPPKEVATTIVNYEEHHERQLWPINQDDASNPIARSSAFGCG